MFRHCIVVAAAVAALGVAMTASAADVAAGEALVKQVCSECHDPSMWKGKSSAEIDALIHQVVAGKVTHPKKLTLTDAQMADIAAYWSSVANK